MSGVNETPEGWEVSSFTLDEAPPAVPMDDRFFWGLDQEAMWSARSSMLCMFGSVEAVGLGALMPMELLYGRALGLEPMEVALCLTARGFGAGLSSLALERLARHRGATAALMVATAAAAAGYLAQALAQHVHLRSPYAAGKLLCGLSSGVSGVIQAEFIMCCALEKTVHTRLRIYRWVTALFGALLPLPFALLAKGLSLSAPYWASFAIAAGTLCAAPLVSGPAGPRLSFSEQAGSLLQAPCSWRLFCFAASRLLLSLRQAALLFCVTGGDEPLASAGAICSLLLLFFVSKELGGASQWAGRALASALACAVGTAALLTFSLHAATAAQFKVAVALLYGAHGGFYAATGDNLLSTYLYSAPQAAPAVGTVCSFAMVAGQMLGFPVAAHLFRRQLVPDAATPAETSEGPPVAALFATDVAGACLMLLPSLGRSSACWLARDTPAADGCAMKPPLGSGTAGCEA